MKRVYPIMLAVCLCVTALHPGISMAQCTCWTGLPATPVVTTYTLAPTNVSSATLDFAQFDPSVGTLSCMSFNYNINATTTTIAVNLAPSTALLPPSNPEYSPSGKLQYIFSLLTSATITGTNLNIAHPAYTVYGPDSLSAAGTPGDSITYGPDNVINGVSGTTSITPDASYMGTGTAFLDYAISGGLNTIEGGLDFAQQITTTIWGNFSLTYYWCPQQPLATSIVNFTAVPDGDHIQIQWLSTNEQQNTNYEIQVSTDGQNFTTIGETQSNPATAGTTAKYQYQYDPNQATVGKLYFRIKVIDVAGQATYSAVLVVVPGTDTDAGPISYQTYPNPASNSLLIQFNKNQTARYLLELVNTAGQVVQQTAITLTGTSQARMDFSPQPAKGLYFLRTIDQTHNQSYVSKVLIN
jgi:Secretion system C-terminal sorting domain/F5/8 type C domain